MKPFFANLEGSVSFSACAKKETEKNDGQGTDSITPIENC